LLIALVWPAVIADISFQLSFLAVLFIVWGMREDQRLVSQEKNATIADRRSWLPSKVAPAGHAPWRSVVCDARNGPVDRALFRPSFACRGLSPIPIIVPLVGFVVVPLGLGYRVFFL
jgi:hypothetical protein